MWPYNILFENHTHYNFVIYKLIFCCRGENLLFENVQLFNKITINSMYIRSWSHACMYKITSKTFQLINVFTVIGTWKKWNSIKYHKYNRFYNFNTF